MAGKGVSVTIGGRQLSLSNLDKVLYPATGFTKAQVIEYYTRVAPHILPHLRARPITLKRYPEGVDGFFFYEKRCPAHRPAWVVTSAVPVKSGEINFCTIDDEAALAWLGNIACLEIHTYLYTVRDLATPTMLVFDLDPGEPAALADSCRVGLLVRELLERLGLRAFAKVSGSKGLHLAVPLNTAVDFDRTKAFARAVAEALERRDPKRVISSMSKAERAGKVFIDWSQNDQAKTTCNVYSLRAKERPTVSLPVTWEQVERAAAGRDLDTMVLDAPDALRLLDRRGDLWADVLTLKQRLPDPPLEAGASAPRASAAKRAPPAKRAARPAPSRTKSKK